MSGELGTTNLLLGIMAAVSVLEALVVIGIGVAGFLAYRKVMEKEDVAEIPVRGFGRGPKDNEIRIENRKVGAGVKITGDHPLSDGNLWSIRTVLAMEPFIALTVAPGREVTWKMTYDYYTLPSKRK